MFDVKNNTDIMDIEVDNSKADRASDINQSCTNYSGMVHSKKVIKHALRQQAKRRRKNTTIASGNSRALPQIVVKPLAPPPAPPPVSSPVLVNEQQTSIQHNNTVEEPAATMREVLASLPGFSLKSIRRRSTKKLSAAAQLEAGLVDLESPASILSSTSLRALLNRHTFQGLPPLYQRKLAQLLPSVDRQDAATSGLNNEFFARACLEWRKRLAEGEFTPENQQRLKMEAEKDKNKLDPWKLKHFEPIWGDKREPKLRVGLHCIGDSKTATTTTTPTTPLPTPTTTTTTTPASHGGAVTRSSLRLRLESSNDPPPPLITANKLLFTRKNIIEKPETDIETELTVTTNIDVIKLNENESQCNDELINDKLLNPINNIDDEIETETETETIENPAISKMEIEEENPVKIDDKYVDEIDDTKVITINTDYPEKIDSELFVGDLDDTIKSNDHTIDDCLTINLNNDIKLTDNEQFDEHYDSPKNDKLYINDDNIDLSSSDIKNDLIIDDGNIIDVQISDDIGSNVDENVPIPDGMEIDSETLKRIHELEVRGEMREAYEEISGCNEEIIYPILEGMDIVSNCSEDNEPQNCAEQSEELPENLAVGNDDEELRDANNYVCSEMLDCSWSVDQDAGAGGADGTGDIQVPWPLVAAALDGSVAANITVETQEDCSDGPTVEASVQQFEAVENACVTLPQANQGQYQETMTLSAPANNCLLKNVQTQNSPIIAFPPLQSIRFVPRFHQNNAAGVARVNQPVASNLRIGNGLRSGPVPVPVPVPVSVPVPVPVPVSVSVPVVQGQQSAIVVQQHQTGINVPVTQRQIVASVPQGFNGTNSRSRSSGQGYRAARNGGKEQGGRSRSSTKEPPGAVNLERSYQICQAVIQSSPNRDQLKAHLKPPPSLLARGDGAFTTSKSGGRTITTVKSQKQSIQQNKPQQQSKTQTVMLRQVFTTTRPQQIDVNDVNNTTTAVAQIGTVTGNGTTNFGQYILVQRTGVSDCAPRASSAPPLPPQIAGLGVGVHLVRGRPASAGEGSHHAVTLKARGINDTRGGGAEPSAPGVIMGGDPPPPCECQMRGAMVICRQCGAFCHDDCIGPQRICATCLIR